MICSCCRQMRQSPPALLLLGQATEGKGVRQGTQRSGHGTDGGTKTNDAYPVHSKACCENHQMNASLQFSRKGFAKNGIANCSNLIVSILPRYLGFRFELINCFEL